FADLRSGDFVVHEDHGVGKLLGFETKEVAGVTRDYLFLGFRGDDRLYVPHEQLGKVSRYIGADTSAPALSKLGGKAWDNLKTRARESVRELAAGLLALYAQRQQAPGVAYDLRHEYLERLEAEFPYRETPDQQAAIEAVKEDLEAPRPMDRLVCGDVGFGKTEVAIRAAFRVASSGRQVAVLCPTTVLAQQHFLAFQQRFSGYPINVRNLSRFTTATAARDTIAGMKQGGIEPSRHVDHHDAAGRPARYPHCRFEARRRRHPRRDRPRDGSGRPGLLRLQPRRRALRAGRAARRARPRRAHRRRSRADERQ